MNWINLYLMLDEFKNYKTLIIFLINTLKMRMIADDLLKSDKIKQNDLIYIKTVKKQQFSVAQLNFAPLPTRA